MTTQTGLSGHSAITILLMRLLVLYGLCTGLALSAPSEPLRFTAPDATSGDDFGAVIALSGDGNTALVSRPSANCQDGGTLCGAVYIFVRRNGQWQSEQKLAAANGAAGAGFGSAAALSGNGDTAVIGAPFRACALGASGCGTAYVFTRANGRWSETQQLTASDARGNERFGTAIALSEDGDTVLVAAPLAPCGVVSQNCGAAYVFARTAVGWNERRRLQPADPVANGNFGASVALSADGLTALVGAPGAVCVSGNGACGAAYAFASDGVAWTQLQRLTPQEAGPDFFGYSVALAADGTTALVGAPTTACATSDSAACGAAYIFTRDLGEWNQSAKLLPATAQGSMQFGFVVDLAGAGNTALVAAPGTVCGTSNAPLACLAAHPFTLKSGQWTAGEMLKPAEPLGLAGAPPFGRSLALSKDGAFALVRALDSKTVSGITVGAVSHFSVLPRLTLAQTYKPNPVVTGDTLVYTLKVTNGSKTRASSVTLTDKLPAKLEFVSASKTCKASGQTVTCKLGALAAGASGTVEITVIPRIPGKFINTLTLKSPGFAPLTTQETTTVKPNTSGVADLSVTVKASRKTAKPGGKLSYTLTALNAGPSDATNVTLTDTLPPGTSLAAAPHCTQANGAVVCKLGKLGPTQSLQRQITVRVPTELGSLVNSAEVAGSSTDPDPANNSASATAKVK